MELYGILKMNAKEHFKISLCNFTIAPGHSSISLVLFSFAGIEEQKYGPGTTMRCEMQPSATYIHDLKLHLLQSICFSRCSDTQSAETQIIFFKAAFSELTSLMLLSIITPISQEIGLTATSSL